MRIAFAGNPNSGKTTMYNALTGRSERVGNWAGVTVDKKESPIKKHYHEGEELIAVDLPGAYSMSPFTAEESVTRDYVIKEHPDVIINIVDATNLSRSLFFTTQLMELGVPVVVALNKADINMKKETEINLALLSEKLGCPVINTISTISTHESLHQIVDAAVCAKGKVQIAPFTQSYAAVMDKESAKDADKERYKFVNELVRQVEKRKIYTKDRNFQDAIDNILTDPIVGMIVFAAVMFGVFDISQSTVGPALADIFVGWIETFQEWVGGMLTGANDFLYALLIDGIIGGVGAVVGFLPLVMVMYFLIALLEAAEDRRLYPQEQRGSCRFGGGAGQRSPLQLRRTSPCLTTGYIWKSSPPFRVCCGWRGYPSALKKRRIAQGF